MSAAEPAPAVWSADQIHQQLDDARLIEALRAAFVEGGSAPVRQHLTWPRPGEADATLLLMPAWRTGDVAGVKLVTICPGNERRALPSVQGLYVLFDAIGGQPRGVLDATALTLRRTACASALAASYLARRDATHLMLLGAGALAPHLARAHARVRPIRKITIWNRTPARAEALAAELRAGGLEASATDDRAAAIAQADIVSAATMSATPLIEGAWLRPGCHLDLVGGFTPAMREADDAAVARATVFVDTRSGALAEAGDILQPIAHGVLSETAIAADLFELCRGEHPGRRSADEITLFKSVGSALEDLAAARLLLAPAEARRHG